MRAKRVYGDYTMEKSTFLLWMLASPVIAAGLAWLAERARAFTIREWTAALYYKLPRSPR